MLNVSDVVKAKLKSDNCEKEFLVTINGTTIDSNDIYRNSINLTEQIMSNNLEITGCISSVFKVKISTMSAITKGDYHGDPIIATVKINISDGVMSDEIPLFRGFIDTVEKSADGRWQEFTCYDALYYVGSINIYNWYNNKYKAAGYPSFNTKSITLKQFRDNLFAYCAGNGISLQQVTADLPNDTMKIRKRFKNKDLTLMEVLQGLCQINGCFGIINREGKFEYRYIGSGTPSEPIGAYPSLFYPNQVYPSQPISQGSSGDGDISSEFLECYESIKYSDTAVNPIQNGITMRNNSSDAGVMWDSEEGASTSWEDDTTDDALIDDSTEITSGTYILDGNMFAYKIKNANKKIAIANIYDRIGSDTVFRNHECKSYGLPYLEVGDKVIYQKADGVTTIEFIILKRVLSGDINLKDVYSIDCIDKKDEYIATAQNCMSGTENATSPDEAQDIVDNTIGGDPSTGQGAYMYVVEWNATTGVLKTSSGVQNG